MNVTARLKRLVPGPVRSAIGRPYYEARSRVKFALLKRDLKRRYGSRLVFVVHEDDEMYRFTREFWNWRYHIIRMHTPSDALRSYLVSGDVMMGDLETALRDQGRTLADVDSFLEFASGYGRFTRFLVTAVPPPRVTVSDISHDAVDFARATFGVTGFYSTESAEQLDDHGPYEVIFVASLFSHLAIEHWVPWLRRLYDLLAPGGLLVFSTHGPYVRDVIYGKYWRDRLQEKESGFSYLLTNETEGRLPVEYYGSAFVTEEFVRRVVATEHLGTFKQAYPAALWKSQDLYVIEKPASTGAQRLLPEGADTSSQRP